MKKVLSVLLAVCLFAAMIVPAFAAVVESEEGLADATLNETSAVAKIEFDMASYDYAVYAAEGVDLNDLMTAYDKDGNRIDVAQADLTFTSSNEAALTIVGSDITGVNNNTDKAMNIKVTASSSYAGVKDVSATFKLAARTTTVVTAPKAATNYSVVSGKVLDDGNDYTAAEFKATPAGTYFTNAQLKGFINSYKELTNSNYKDIDADATISELTVNFTLVGVTKTGVEEDITQADLIAGDKTLSDYVAVRVKGSATEVRAAKAFKMQVRNNGFASVNAQQRRNYVINVIPVAAADTTTLNLIGPAVINVNKGVFDAPTIKLTDGTVVPAKDIDWSIETYGSQTADEGALIAKFVRGIGVDEVIKFKAVAAGVVTLRASYGQYEDLLIKVVVGAGDANDTDNIVITPTSATIAVNGTQWITLKGTDGATWTTSDAKIATVVGGKDGAKVFGKAAGTATITAYINGEAVGTVKVTVTAASTGATQSPQTGDALLNF